jgi:hypothetical protein
MRQFELGARLAQLDDRGNDRNGLIIIYEDVNWVLCLGSTWEPAVDPSSCPLETSHIIGTFSLNSGTLITSIHMLLIKELTKLTTDVLLCLGTVLPHVMHDPI